jgi:hypothetical protein
VSAFIYHGQPGTALKLANGNLQPHGTENRAGFSGPKGAGRNGFSCQRDWEE